VNNYFMEPRDYNDAPIRRVLRIIWSVGLTKGQTKRRSTIDIEGRSSRAGWILAHLYNTYTIYVHRYTDCIRRTLFVATHFTDFCMESCMQMSVWLLRFGTDDVKRKLADIPKLCLTVDEVAIMTKKLYSSIVHKREYRTKLQCGDSVAVQWLVSRKAK
jgi:hypothetical protein